MVDIPNPWLNQSEAENSPVADTAVAVDQPSAAAAVPLSEPSMTMEVPDEAPAAAANPDGCGELWDINGTDRIHEIWFGYGKQPESEFPRGFDPHDYMDTLERIADEIAEPPVFLRQRAAE